MAHASLSFLNIIVTLVLCLCDGTVLSDPAVSWENGPVTPANSTSPYAGARFMYHRIDMGTTGTTGTPPRSSPMDLFVSVWDENLNGSTQGQSEVRKEIENAVSTIYFWDPKIWRSVQKPFPLSFSTVRIVNPNPNCSHDRKELAEAGWDETMIEDILTNKSHFFWEDLAEQVAWRLLKPPTVLTSNLNNPEHHRLLLCIPVNASPDLALNPTKTPSCGRRLQ